MPAAADAAEDGRADDILVTARRRSERLQTVPIAITAVSSEELARAGVQNISQLEAIDPSLTFRAANIASSTANLIVRGLGTTGSNRSFEGSVGIFVDGIYRTRAAAALQNFVDVGDVEVLRGPQGTLFGKNTNGGAVLLSSNRPSFEGQSGSLEANYGSYDSLIVRAALNLPLSHVVAVRAAGTVSHTDGFFDDVSRNRSLNGGDSQVFKLQMLLEPAPGLSIRIIGDYAEGQGNCCYATSQLAVGPLQPLVDELIRAGGGNLPSRRASDREQSLNGDGHQTISDAGVSLIVDVAVPGGSLRSSTGYRFYRVRQTDMDPDFSGADIFRYDEAFRSSFVSQELVYAANIRPLRADVVVGGFASDERLAMDRQLPWAAQAQPVWDSVFAGLGLPVGTADAAPGLIGDEAMGGSVRSYSAFAHADIQLNDRLSVIAGLRYSVEDRTGRFAYRYYRPAPTEPFRLLGIQPGPAYDDRHHDGALSGTLGFELRPWRNVTTYLTYNRGFKAGGVNIDANGAGTRANNPAEVADGTPLSAEYQPETIDAFEFGAKAGYLGGRAQTNVAIFYYDIAKLQTAQFVGLRTTIINASSATDYGAEIENTLRISPALSIEAAATWIPHARYGRGGGIDPVLAGARFRFTPVVSTNIAALLERPVSPAINLTGRLAYRFRSAQFVDTAGTTRQEPTHLVDASLGLRLPASDLEVNLMASNLLDVTYVEQALATPLQAGSISGFLAPPRTIQVRVSKRL
ncbi:TonB-dependent receptor [Sphingomonas sp. NBWT7]|uniref:TonB-dependent receptor n=1 Tax=Sphingomonas sp. NBWT7 TaxID=2596913 RepID=UPI0021561E7D|nr:TonB-dependent receptor [Sphingomonas sp. NBWT7]